MPRKDAHLDREEQARPWTAALFAGEPEALPVSFLLGDTFYRKNLEPSNCSDTIVEP
jgi:hypothetical protein